MKKMLFVLSAVFAAAFFSLGISAAEDASPATLEAIALKQDEILIRLEEIKSELNIIKVRATN